MVTLVCSWYDSEEKKAVKKPFSKLEIDKYCKLAYDYLDKQVSVFTQWVKIKTYEILILSMLFVPHIV